ncbi:simple sugar transport system ATP-binding protein/ribose transport system ATP-binding protein [Alkalispirochaeta americana]|uniref:Simple sugar transport system ATP-binding protein/ribose transport system ATP-binding protein n=1 Tax=Alkalispirochaeta americana TaxID=159291 RepID=A0A1N6PRG3_9SPIO|nr:ATP-binding cassette domain-containing protein [Alkalispirochaeta americana]SIQ06923.1 simple sugar transport system ATP-binding protein/ribose transport system ATP-binding protein [Alkalispirochaeta americana]
MTALEPVLTAEHIGKRYGAVQALQNASISLFPGEIHGLAGENGAGKSTFVRILAGIESPDRGYLRGCSPGHCAVVPQYPRMASSLPVMENLIVGREPRLGRLPGVSLFLNRREAARIITGRAKRFGIDLDTNKPAGSLNGTELRLASLLAALAQHPKVLILDEPTVGLARPDQERILRAMRTLREQGVAILYISHDLGEISGLADRVTLLRQGSTSTSSSPVPPAEELAAQLFDHHRETIHGNTHQEKRQQSPASSDEAGLVCEELLLHDAPTGRTVGPLSFKAPRGTITALTGVRESGLDLLEQYLGGQSTLAAGALSAAGQRVPARIVPGLLRQRGIAFIPSDRFDRAAALEGSVEENATVIDRNQVYQRGFRTPGEAKHVTNRLLKRFDIRTHRHMPLGSLSGGMIQKLILARELDTNPRICIIAEPTAGLDLQSQHILLESLREIAATGAAVLLLSSSIDAVTSLASRVVVLHHGLVQGDFLPHQEGAIARAFAGISS